MATQDSPIQDGSADATEEQKIAGIIAQTRADYLQGVATDVASDLQHRLIDAGIELDSDRVASLAQKVTGD